MNGITIDDLASALERFGWKPIGGGRWEIPFDLDIPCDPYSGYIMVDINNVYREANASLHDMDQPFNPRILCQAIYDYNFPPQSYDPEYKCPSVVMLCWRAHLREVNPPLDIAAEILVGMITNSVRWAVRPEAELVGREAMEAEYGSP